MARIPRRSQRDALRQLVTRLNTATERREDARRGTREFREAERAERRYQRILLDDDLFERFIEGEGNLDPQGNGRQLPRETKPVAQGAGWGHASGSGGGRSGPSSVGAVGRARFASSPDADDDPQDRGARKGRRPGPNRL